MKKLISYFILIAVVLAVVSCKENNNVPEPAVPVSKEDSIKALLLKPVPTKEPYITLEDDGFEAELIAQGIDTDNQINGRIALEDVGKTENFGRPVVIQPNSKEAEYYKPMLTRYTEVMPLLKKEFKGKTGTELIVKQITDINKFKKLKYLYLNFSINPVDSLDLSANTQLEIFETSDAQIKVINFDNCKQIKKINFGYSTHPLKTTILHKIYVSKCPGLEYLSYNGDPRTLDISLNTNLKYLQIVNRGDLNPLKLEKLDLCNNPHLASLFVEVSYYKDVYLSKGVYATYENSKKQNLPNGFPLLDATGALVNVCK